MRVERQATAVSDDGGGGPKYLLLRHRHRRCRGGQPIAFASYSLSAMALGGGTASVATAASGVCGRGPRSSVGRLVAAFAASVEQKKVPVAAAAAAEAEAVSSAHAAAVADGSCRGHEHQSPPGRARENHRVAVDQEEEAEMLLLLRRRRQGGARGGGGGTWSFTAAVCTVLIVLATLFALGAAQQRYRFCVVKNAENRMLQKHCSQLKGAESRAECVFGNSRLDCLRLISKNEADFSIFEAEDVLVASRDKGGDFVVTHNIQNHESEFEFRMVVIVRNTSNIRSLRDLRNRNMCHPGHGADHGWTEVEGKFFEERVIPQSCDSALSLRENFIRSSSHFFKAACKAGPWVPDPKEDAMLKRKYSNLCSLCDRPKICSKQDKYWGRTGPLYCLTDGYGDFAWARLDDTNFHFGLTSGSTAIDDPNDYYILCDDGSRVSLKSPNPCSWLDRPWPAIIAQRYASIGVQKLIASLKHNPDSNWQQAFQQMLESNRLNLVPLLATKVPEDYLATVSGFLSANSIIHCDKQLRFCTYSESANTKCNWLSEAARANGIEPFIICEQRDNVEKCMEDVSNNNSDFLQIENDYLAIAMRNYKLSSLLHEQVDSSSRSYNIVAVVPANSAIKSLEDLKGKRACFSRFEGAGWNTAVSVLKTMNILPIACPNGHAMGPFFSEMCIPGLNKNNSIEKKLNNKCADPTNSITYIGENGAVNCIRSGKGDVAFVALNAVFNDSDEVDKMNLYNMKNKEFNFLCVPNKTKECFLSQAVPGHIMVKSNLSKVKSDEVKMVLQYLNYLFGKNSKQQKKAFQIYAPFDGLRNILFHDDTEKLEETILNNPDEKFPPNYLYIIQETTACSSNTNCILKASHLLICISFLSYYFA